MEAKTKKPKAVKERNGLSRIAKIIITIGSVLLVFGLVGAWFTSEETKRQNLIQYKKEQLEVTFDNSEQKHDVIDLLDIDYHPLTQGKTMDSLGRTQDTLGLQLQRVDTLLVDVYNQKQRDARAKRTQDSIYNIDKIALQKNREKKYKLQEKMLDQLILIKVDLRKINKRLDTIN